MADCRFCAGTDSVMEQGTCYATGMQERVKVVLYGDTLVLAALQASLESYAGIEVVALREPAGAEQELIAFRPNVVIFDIGAVQPAFQYALVDKLPDLMLVGIDPATNRVVVWSGQQLRELSTEGLVQAITHRLTPAGAEINSHTISDPGV
jgi:hypothetical protein